MGHLTLKVFPASKQQKIEIHAYEGIDSHRSQIGANEADITVRLSEKAQQNKANVALIKTLKKLTGAQVRIRAGASSRLKIIEFDGEKEDFLKKIKSALSSGKQV